MCWPMRRVHTSTPSILSIIPSKLSSMMRQVWSAMPLQEYVTTLAAVLGGMIDLLRGGRRGATLLVAVTVAALAGALGQWQAIGAGYRAVGWVSAVSMLALACRADALLLRGEKG